MTQNNIIVIDEDGDWYRVTGEFPMPHHARALTLRPGNTYRLKEDEWLKGQPVIEKVADPFAKPKSKAEPAPAAESAPKAGK